MKKTVVLTCVVASLVAVPVIGNASSSDSANTMSPGNVEMTEIVVIKDPITIIEKDHMSIRQMISELNQNLDTNFEQSKILFKKLQDFLKLHETMEQTAWYTALSDNKKTKPVVEDLKKEEDAAGKGIDEINNTKDKDQWISKVKDFLKKVDAHAKNEEEKLFPKVRDAFDKPALEKMGNDLRQYRTKNGMENY